MTLKEKQLAFLVETAEHYNSTNRCKSDGYCAYHPARVGMVGWSEGCAIGRKLPEDLAETLDTCGESVRDARIWYLLPVDMQELGQYFLKMVQDLHDEDKYWNDLGLSEEGLREFYAIVKFINDEVEEVN